MSVVRRRTGKLAAIVAGLAALAAFVAGPAAATHAQGAGRPEVGALSSEHGGLMASDPVVNFRTSPPAILSCTMGVIGGAANGDTANITSTALTVTAVVTLHAPAGTFFSGQLTQGPICFPTETFQGTVPAGQSSVTVTVTDTRGVGATGAFVSVVKDVGLVGTRFAGGLFEITPLVGFSGVGGSD
jgi:hypothetical protein